MSSKLPLVKHVVETRQVRRKPGQPPTVFESVVEGAPLSVQLADWQLRTSVNLIDSFVFVTISDHDFTDPSQRKVRVDCFVLFNNL